MAAMHVVPKRSQQFQTGVSSIWLRAAASIERFAMNTPRPEPRYAIYFVPGLDTTLYRFGASVLGYDCYAGQNTALIDGADALSWNEFVREPRVYGFHATLKAPFFLAKGSNEADLERAVRDFAADQPAVLIGDLAIRELGSFIALVPESQRPSLDRLARACVQEFDRFRSPMNGAERERRLAAGLSARQIENLERWGYPHVLEDFRFHMTLTGSLPLHERNRVLRFLCNKFEQTSGARSLTIDQIVLARQADKSAHFRVIGQGTLGQSPYRPYAYSC
jgi:putative phosphonate metabolism protein